MFRFSIREGFYNYLIKGLDKPMDKEYLEFMDYAKIEVRKGHRMRWFDIPDHLVEKVKDKYIPAFMDYWWEKYPNCRALRQTAYRLMGEMEEYLKKLEEKKHIDNQKKIM